MQNVPIEIECAQQECLPVYASEQAVGADLKAYIFEDIVLLPSERILVPTGIKLSIPEGYEVQIRPRSGLACKHGITIVNTPGTIDPDYRGMIQVLLCNTGKEPFTITPFMRIAQMVVAPYCKAQFQHQELQSTARGTKGFGATGTH